MDWYLSLALVLIGAGIVALVAEFLLPTGGILVVAALGLIATGIGVVVIYGDSQEAAASVIGVSIAVPILGSLMVSAWRRLSLKSALTADPDADSSLGTIPILAELESLKGRTGRTVSPMRPAGVVDFDGRRIDAVCEGGMLDAGTPVRCVFAKSGRVVVRATDPGRAASDLAEPPLSGLND